MIPLTDPMGHVCPNCNAQVGKRCTQPTNSGRVETKFLHLSRVVLAQEATHE